MPATSGRGGLVLPLSLPHPRPCEINPAWCQPRLKRMMDLGADGVSTRHVPAGHQVSFQNSGLKLLPIVVIVSCGFVCINFVRTCK